MTFDAYNITFRQCSCCQCERSVSAPSSLSTMHGPRRRSTVPTCPDWTQRVRTVRHTSAIWRGRSSSRGANRVSLEARALEVLADILPLEPDERLDIHHNFVTREAGRTRIAAA